MCVGVCVSVCVCVYPYSMAAAQRVYCAMVCDRVMCLGAADAVHS